MKIGLHIFLLALLYTSPTWAADSYYSIQLGSFSDKKSATQFYKHMQVYPEARIERIGKYYTARIGLWLKRQEAEALLPDVKQLAPQATIRKAYYRQERLIRPDSLNGTGSSMTIAFSPQELPPEHDTSRTKKSRPPVSPPASSVEQPPKKQQTKTDKVKAALQSTDSADGTAQANTPAATTRSTTTTPSVSPAPAASSSDAQQAKSKQPEPSTDAEAKPSWHTFYSYHFGSFANQAEAADMYEKIKMLPHPRVEHDGQDYLPRFGLWKKEAPGQAHGPLAQEIAETATLQQVSFPPASIVLASFEQHGQQPGVGDSAAAVP